MALAPRITRGSTTFDLDSSNGVVVTGLEEEEEWSEERGTRINRAGGLFEANLFQAGRARLAGDIHGTSLANLRTRLGSLLFALGDGGEDVRLRIHDDREILCRPTPRGHGWYGASLKAFTARWEVDLVSVDPHWRALSDTTFSKSVSGNGEDTVTFTNGGDAPAPFLLDIGPSSGTIVSAAFEIVRDSPTPIEKLRLGRVIVAGGKVLRIDFETGSVTDGTGGLGLAEAFAEYVDGVCFLLPPGSNTLRFRQNSAASLAVSYSGSFRARFQIL